MWWIIGLIVIGVIIYKINSEHKEDVDSHITKFGGMEGKYGEIIEYLESSGLHIQKTTKDSIVLSSTSATWMLDFVEPNLEVRMRAYVPLLGKINKKWIFPSSYPQEKMIEEFDNYADWQIEQLKKATQHNPYEHIDLD